MRRVKQFIEEGRLGRLLHVSGYVKWHRAQDYYEANDWRGRTDREGGGVIFSQAGHTLDLMQWIGGPVEWVFTNMVTAPVHKDIDIENLATVTLRFTNGATGTLEAATAIYPGTPERLEFHGTRGTIALEAGNIVAWQIQDATSADEPDDVEELTGSGASDPMAFPITWHKRQIADFADAVQRGRPPLVDGHEGRKLNDLCATIYRSAKTGAAANVANADENETDTEVAARVCQTVDDRPLILMDPYPRPLKLIFSDEDRARLNALGRVLWYEGICAPDEHIEAHLPEAVALIGQAAMPRERLDRAPNLRAIFNVEGNFLQNIDYQECHRRNIHVLACSRAFAPAVAELALGLALAAARGIVENDAAFRRGGEKYSATSNTNSRLLRGKTMGLLGCGNVARMLLPLIEPLGGKILVHDPWLHKHQLEDLGLAPVDLDTLARHSDVLFVLSAATAENGHQLGAEQFAQMRPGTIVVLVGRAEVVDFEALLDAADSGRIRAAIDVFPEEPVPSNDRVRHTANVILSGHRAGGLPETYHGVGRMVVDDLEMILRGLPPGQLQPAVLETISRQRGKPITAAVMKKGTLNSQPVHVDVNGQSRHSLAARQLPVS